MKHFDIDETLLAAEIKRLGFSDSDIDRALADPEFQAELLSPWNWKPLNNILQRYYPRQWEPLEKSYYQQAVLPDIAPKKGYIYCWLFFGGDLDGFAYVGQGVGNRYLDHLTFGINGNCVMQSYAAMHVHLLNGHIVKCIILASNLETIAEKDRLEISEIATRGRFITGNGSLLNITAGGRVGERNGNIALCHNIFDANNTLSRDELRLLCLDAGINEVTFGRQYVVWANQNGRTLLYSRTGIKIGKKKRNGHVKLSHDIFNANPEADPKTKIRLCTEAGICKSTSTTQLSYWNRRKKIEDEIGRTTTVDSPAAIG